MAEEEEEHQGMPAREKVAILMIALGQETTAEVMKYLADLEVEQIAQAISELDVVTTEQEDEVLEEVLVDALVLDVLELVQRVAHGLVEGREVVRLQRHLHELQRLFSPAWQQMQQAKTLPKETRTLTNPGTATPQGSIVLRIEILEHKLAIAQPMMPTRLPSKSTL